MNAPLRAPPEGEPDPPVTLPRAPRPAFRWLPRRRNTRERIGRTAIISLGIHLFILGLALIVWSRNRKPEPPPDQPGFAVVFQGGEKSPKAVPNPGKFVTAPNQGSPSPPAPQPRQAPETPTQQAMAQPAPREEAPQAAPRVNLFQGFDLPPPEEAPRQVKPTPRKAPRQVARRAPQARDNPFAHPMVLSFAPTTPGARSSGLRGSRSLDLSLGLTVKGGQLQDAVPHISSPGADGDYIEALAAYVETHKFYPERAAREGEAGTAVIKAVIERSGQVKDVRLVESSGSKWLDLAWLSLFRNKKLAPFPDDMKEAEREFTLSMTYELIYR